jgi:hypothetical protein
MANVGQKVMKAAKAIDAPTWQVATHQSARLRIKTRIGASKLVLSLFSVDVLGLSLATKYQRIVDPNIPKANR